MIRVSPKINRMKADKSNFMNAYCTRAQLYCDPSYLTDGPQAAQRVPQL